MEQTTILITSGCSSSTFSSSAAELKSASTGPRSSPSVAMLSTWATPSWLWSPWSWCWWCCYADYAADADANADADADADEEKDLSKWVKGESDKQAIGIPASSLPKNNHHEDDNMMMMMIKKKAIGILIRDICLHTKVRKLQVKCKNNSSSKSKSNHLKGRSGLSVCPIRKWHFLVGKGNAADQFFIKGKDGIIRAWHALAWEERPNAADFQVL